MIRGAGRLQKPQDAVQDGRHLFPNDAPIQGGGTVAERLRAAAIEIRRRCVEHDHDCAEARRLTGSE